MHKLLAKKVDVFTDQPLAGNPAGVIHGAERLGESQLLALAREMGLAETVFVLQGSEEEGTPLRLRSFNSTGEVHEPGHATLAAYHSLVEEKALVLKGPSSKFTHANTKGTREVEVRPRGAFEQVMLSMERPSFGEPFDEPEKILEATGLTKGQVRKELPMQVMDEHTVLVPVDSLATLEKLAPDLDAVGKLKRKHKVHHLVPFTTETQDMASNYHLRCYAPALGMPEDPVTASVHARLGAYLVRHKVVRATTGGQTNLTGEQGHFLGRPGKVLVEVRSEGQNTRDVRIGGTAVTVLRGEITLP